MGDIAVVVGLAGSMCNAMNCYFIYLFFFNFSSKIRKFQK